MKICFNCHGNVKINKCQINNLNFTKWYLNFLMQNNNTNLRIIKLNFKLIQFKTKIIIIKNYTGTEQNYIYF